MALPTTREEFKRFCLGRLGAPVIKINVADEQIDDRIDYALRKFMDYHFDAISTIYYKHQITAEDIANKYITLPENIIGAVNIFPVGGGIGGTGMFSIQYQVALNDLYTYTSTPMLPYYTAMYNLQSMEQLLTGLKPLRYNRYKNQLHVDMDWNIVAVGQFLIVEAYEVVDPNEYSRVWQDSWLMQYTTAQIKEAWGTNLSKFNGLALVGGVGFDGLRILNEARDEILRLEQTLYNDYSLPPAMLIG
jgi:hypothetical protein